ncbi:hypothetical protein H8356DRAFT_1616918 [Neocallimastix lanati (nom. inval.)]|jgi:hypothetical protein|nr:hypothetical protein H8356DRAFT_1616918 [Neocallimastix sp. JGI-2020a]
MSAYPSQPHTDVKDPKNPLSNDNLKGSLNREMEAKLLSEEERNEICPKSPNHSVHEFNHEYDKFTLFMMMIGLPMFFRVKKEIICKHCHKKFAKYTPQL